MRKLLYYTCVIPVSLAIVLPFGAVSDLCRVFAGYGIAAVAWLKQEFYAPKPVVLFAETVKERREN